MSDLPPPKKLSKSATVAEKQEREAVMKERKRCQDQANKRKRARGAERSEENIDAVAASSIISNGKRAKSGDHGGHRDGAGRKPEDVVSSSFRRGDPQNDVWPINLCPNGEMYVLQP